MLDCLHMTTTSPPLAPKHSETVEWLTANEADESTFLFALVMKA
jgi:hypothetical protein